MTYIVERLHPPVASVVVEKPKYDPDHVYAWEPANNYKGWKLIARGESEVDDADVIQSAIDVGGKIHISKGEYNINKPILLSGYEKIEGAGFQNTKLIATSSIDAVFKLKTSGAARITIMDLFVDSNNLADFAIDLGQYPYGEAYANQGSYQQRIIRVQTERSLIAGIRLDANEDSLVDGCIIGDKLLWDVRSGAGWITNSYIKSAEIGGQQVGIYNTTIFRGLKNIVTGSIIKLDTVYIYSSDSGKIIDASSRIRMLIADNLFAIIRNDGDIVISGEFGTGGIIRGLQLENPNNYTYYIFDVQSQFAAPNLAYFVIEIVTRYGTGWNYETSTNDAIIEVLHWDNNAKRVQVSKNKSYNNGTATFSGDGSTTQFKIAHGLVSTPNKGKTRVWALSADAADNFWIDVDDTYIYVNYKTAPPSGTDNIVLGWYAEV